MGVWAVIAAYNEEKNLAPVLEGVKNYVDEVVVVDDGSADGTSNVAIASRVNVLRHPINLGKGAAVRTGVEFAIEKGADKIVLIDADGQHEPDEIPKFLSRLDRVDIVFGTRKFDENMPVVLRFGNRLLHIFTRLLFGVSVRDTQSGFRAFRAQAYPLIRWSADGYAMETEMLVNVGKHKLSYEEVPIKTIYHDRYKGTTMLDGVKIAFRMLSLKLRG
ncbi:glycosyltransferase family 2 protein [Candidatus Woesearchaeota archaeon]|nr:MAG: glycosyltransferase family 2 protein [Candidatus Woesearchaeota archaeon]